MTTRVAPSALTLALASVLSLATTACDSPDFETPAERAARNRTGVRYEVEKKIDPDKLISKGHELFDRNCTSCHGKGGTGRVGIGPALASASFLSAADDAMLTRTIKTGRQGTTMTAWGNTLRPEELTATVAYIRSLTPHTPAKLNESPVKGDISAGEKVFSSICARCHGRNGAGYMESSSGTGIGRRAFLDSVSNGYLRHIIKYGKTNTQMKSFRKDAPTAVANLTDQQIEDVIAYMRSRAW